MARIYVKGYTKPDGTKVKGHYREVNTESGGAALALDRKNKKYISSKIKMGESAENAYQKIQSRYFAARTLRGAKSATMNKRLYGRSLAMGVNYKSKPKGI